MMDLYAAERELAIRLYHWSAGEYARQRETGYPMLRTISNRGAGIFLRLVSPLTEEQEVLLGTALLKRAHPKAIQHLGLAATEEEQALTDRYVALYRHALMQTPRPQPTGTLVERRKLVGKVVRALQPILGKPAERDVYDTTYNTPINDWELTTIIGSGRSSFDCAWMLGRSDHNMSRFSRDNPDPRGHNHNFDYPSLLGMFAGISWEYVTEDSLTAALEGMLIVCSYLKREIPPLLEGLGIRDEKK